jgi:hypothetical protein
MYRLIWIKVFLLVAVFALGTTGCPKSGLNTEYVEGTVMMDGKPLDNANISFSPVTEGQGTPAVGVTDANGKYVLTAMQGGRDGRGTTPGQYNVSVFKEIATKHYTDEEMAELVRREIPPDWGYKVVVPEKYTNPKKSGLTFEVKKGKNKFDFEVKE